MASLFGGDKTQTTTTNGSTTYDPWVSASQQQLQNYGNGLLSPFVSQSGTYGVAGVNPDQEMGWGLARNYATSAFNGSNGYQPFGPTQNASFNEGRGAAQLNPNDIAKFQNPYMDQVVNATMANGYGNWQNQDADLAAKYAAAHSFGGSGEALARGTNAAKTGESLINAIAQMRGQGYDRAAALAGQNTGYQQQANMQGQQIANQMTLHNVDANNQYGYQNSVNNNQATQNAIQMLLNGGGQQRDITNQAVQWPFQALQLLSGITPKAYNSQTQETKVSPDNSPDPFMQLIGLGLSAAKFL